MASFILLQQLGPFALQRSRTVLVFYAFNVTDVLRPIMAVKRPIVVEGNTPGKPKTNSSRQRDALREAYSEKKHSNKGFWKERMDES